MVKEYSLLFIILLVITPSLMMVSQPIAISNTVTTSSSPVETDVHIETPDEDVELNMMFFTETSSSEDGLYYVCRRGTDTVAYFGASTVKYLSGGTVFTLEFPGSKSVVPEGEHPTGSTTNYLYGNEPSNWKTGIDDCAVLRYSEIYPGIDLVYKIQDGNLKYEFVVSPYADPDVIQLDYVDAETTEILDDTIVVARNGQKMADTQLSVFQKNGDIGVGCQFSLNEKSSVSFNLDNYDHSIELVIDPVFLAYSTFLGGSNSDIGYSIAVENGYFYITGDTWSSSDFPTVNAYDSSYNGGNTDCFVVKFNSDGQSLVYSTFLGGSAQETGQGIAVENGYAYIAGWTSSPSFPVFNAYNATYSGGSTDSFVTKLASDGQSLVYSTFLGGSSGDYGNGVAVENGYAYITGRTYSTDFPVFNAYESTYNGGVDCFVTKLASDGQSLVYSTFLGGSLFDVGYGIAVENGNIYITGQVTSADFPVINAYDASFNGGIDCFVTKLASDGQSLVYSTFLGGSSSEYGRGVAVENGYAYITGDTASTGFPVFNAYDATHNGGGTDCFVTKLASDGQSLVYSTFLGGSDYDYGRGVAVENGHAYITGYTGSTDFPTSSAYESTYNGGSDDCFVTKLASDGQSLVYSTFLGGSSHDFGKGVAVENGYTYITGRTYSTDFPTSSAYDSTYNGGSDDCFISIIVEEDSDSDDLNNWEEEFLYGTDLFCVDSDHDNYLDFYEIQCGTDPLDPDVYPGMNYDMQYSTYLGGSLDDIGYDIAVEDGYVYVTGKTHSENFPTANAIDATHNGMSDVYVLKLANDGRSIIYSTFIGGSDDDQGKSIAVSSGWVYVTGYTCSTDFPTVNAYDSTHNDDLDCFALRLTPSGESLWYSTYLGGSDVDYGVSIAVWNSLAYITGYTRSAGYPTTAGAFDTSLGGNRDAFVTKLTSDGSTLVYSTFLGDAGDDHGYGIAVEDAYAYITGPTTSTNFPISNAYDATHNGGHDAFVSKLSKDGTSLIYSTFIGGETSDVPEDIDVEDGYVYITGTTGSLTFPTHNAYCSSHNGDNRDVFVTKLATDGKSLVYSTFLGGTAQDYGRGLAVDNGYAYVTGYTNSTDFPTTFNETSGLGKDTFVTMISKHGRNLVYSTILGGAGADRGEGIAVYNGAAYVTGYTTSSEFPTRMPLDPSYNGNYDTFILMIGLDSDRDGLCDLWENNIGTDPTWIDSDYDNFLDYYEFAYGSNATDPTDYPAIPQDWYDSIYHDLDGNATLLQHVIIWLEGNVTLISSMIDDIDEFRVLLDGLGISVGDTDYDGLDDLEEIALGTDIQCIDTDCDNLNDAYEVKIGTDPLDDDSDDDSYMDGAEVLAGTDPLDALSYPGSDTTTTTTTTTPTSSTPPVEPFPLILVITIAGVGAVVIVVIIFSVRRRK